MKISYYPGCSLEGTAKEYDGSTRAVCEALGIELVELPDWNCCGANAAAAVNEDLGVQLALRNLAIADATGMDVVIPCVGCFNRMRWAKSVATEDPARAGDVRYEGKTSPVFLLDYLTRDEVTARVKAAVKRPLKGLKLACYYGCVIVRPPKKTGAKDHENPRSLDDLMAAVGAAPVDWPYKTDCCGTDMGITRPDVMKTLVGKLLDMAAEAGAEALVVACPLCHSNLDTRQGEIVSENLGRARMPVFFFTELLGVALGAPGSKDWWGKHIENPAPLLSARGL